MGVSPSVFKRGVHGYLRMLRCLGVVSYVLKRGYFYKNHYLLLECLLNSRADAVSCVSHSLDCIPIRELLPGQLSARLAMRRIQKKFEVAKTESLHRIYCTVKDLLF